MEQSEFILESHEGFTIVRDDLFEGGTKRRILSGLLPKMGGEDSEFVYASTPYGYGKIALSLACRDLGLKATIICPKLENPTPLYKKVVEAGAHVILMKEEVSFDDIVKKAQDYVAQTSGAVFVEPGLDNAFFIDELARIIKAGISLTPSEVWCASGSGALTRALQIVWPDATHHAVYVRKKNSRFGIDCDPGQARIYKVEEDFSDKALEPPPFPASDYYEAKIWRVVKAHASPNALVWNM